MVVSIGWIAKKLEKPICAIESFFTHETKYVGSMNSEEIEKAAFKFGKNMYATIQSRKNSENIHETEVKLSSASGIIHPTMMKWFFLSDQDKILGLPKSTIVGRELQEKGRLVIIYIKSHYAPEGIRIGLSSPFLEQSVSIPLIEPPTSIGISRITR